MILANNYLMVPLKVQVLYVKDCNSGVYAKTGWDMNSLKDNPLGDGVEPEEFSNIDLRSVENPYKKEGLYIHWIVPDAFTKGVPSSEYGSDSIDFPHLCDRFKVFRSIRVAWWKYRDGYYDKVIEVNSPNLDVAKNGDPAYCANYEQCFDELGFFDDLKGFEPDENGYLTGDLWNFSGEICYIVVGYYSEDEQDPLYQFSLHNDDISGFLNEHDLELVDKVKDKKANRIFWFGKCVIPVDHGKLMCDCSVPDGEIKFAVGNNASDAFAAYARDVGIGRMDLMYKFLYEIESHNPHENFEFLVEDDVHNQGFSGVKIGQKAKLVIEEPSMEDRIDVNNLNDTFKEYNRVLAAQDTIREEAYQIWLSAAEDVRKGSMSSKAKIMYMDLAEEYSRINEGYNQEIKDKFEKIDKYLTKLQDKVELCDEDRFWIPSHPCLYAVGEGLHLQFLQGYDDKTFFHVCFITAYEPSDMKKVDDVMRLEEDISDIPYDFAWKEPWNPLLLDWEIRYEPDNTDGIYYYCGKTITSPYLNERMSYLLDEHIKTAESKKSMEDDKDEIGYYDRIMEMTRSLKEKIDKSEMIEQPLGGLWQLFMGREQKFVPDYFKSGFDVGFDDTMRKIYVGKNLYRNSSSDYFSVTGQGMATLTKIRIIDSYGRFREFKEDEIKLSCSEDYKVDDSPNSFYLKSRVLVPSRLYVDEVNRINPVFGWVVPNYVDRTFFLYDSNGNIYGYLFCANDTVEFRKMDTHKEVASPVDVAELEKWKNGIINNGVDEYRDLMQYLENVLVISPEKTGLTEESSILFDGQVLALTKVRIGYEFMGLEPQPISKIVEEGTRSDTRRFYDNILTVIGNQAYSDEGLMLFYKGTGKGDEIDYSNSYRIWDNGKNSSSNNKMVIDFYKDDGYCIAMLMDPSKEVLFSSEILPSVKYRISPQYVSNATKIIHYCSIVGTVYSFTNDKVAIPLPISQNVEWTFKMAKKVEGESNLGAAIYYEDVPVDNLMESKERVADKPMIAEGFLERYRVHKE